MVDVGMSGREIERRLLEIQVDPKSIQALLLSHEHTDHTKGAGVLSRRFDIPIFATLGTWEGIKKTMGIISPHHQQIIEGTFQWGGVKVEPFPLPHDAKEPVGFVFDSQGIRVGMATDVGCIKEEMLRQLIDCQLVILEANHDLELLKNGPYPPPLKARISSPMGHLSNDDAGYAATVLVKGGVSHVILGHLSRENNHPLLAYHTVKNTMEAHDIAVGKDVDLSLVEHMELGRLVKVG